MIQRLYLSDQGGQGAGEENVYIHGLKVWIFVGIGMPFFRMVLPFMDSRAGPYMEEARHTCFAVTVVF